jgi:DNA ligase-associated metallophosphoesterase
VTDHPTEPRGTPAEPCATLVPWGHERTVALSPLRGAWLPHVATLVVADLHVGKEETFRRAGMPVPRGGLDEALGRLDQLARAVPVQRIVIAGDLVHARLGLSDDVVERVGRALRALPAPVLLVRGNHDRGLDRVCAMWSVASIHDRLVLDDGFEVVHDPAHASAPHSVAGHLHPMVAVGGRGAGLAVPAFVRLRRPDGGQTLVLPAFTPWSAGRRFARQATVERWAIAGDRVVALDTRPAPEPSGSAPRKRA